MFFINRLILEVLSPFTFSIIVLILGLLCILFKKNRLGILLQIAGLAILLTLGYGLITRNQFRQLENQYTPLNISNISEDLKKQIRYIVILGSGHVSDSRLPVTSQIGCSSLYRLVEGIRLSQFIPDTQLIVSGGGGYDPVPNAEVVAEVAYILGRKSESVFIENRPHDTLEEAKLLRPLLLGNPFILVTSAAHMPRAMDIFSGDGMAPIAAPTDFILKQYVNPPAGSFFPTTGNLNVSKRIIYEWIGTIWLKVARFLEKFP